MDKNFEINAVQTMTYGKTQPYGSKKGKGKAKQNSQQQEKMKTQPVDETQK
jgi:hypothetical protein